MRYFYIVHDTQSVQGNVTKDAIVRLYKVNPKQLFRIDHHTREMSHQLLPIN